MANITNTANEDGVIGGKDKEAQNYINILKGKKRHPRRGRHNNAPNIVVQEITFSSDKKIKRSSEFLP